MLREEEIVFDFACLISEGWLDEIIQPLDTDNYVSLGWWENEKHRKTEFYNVTDVAAWRILKT